MNRPKPAPFPGLASYLDAAGVDPLYRSEAIGDRQLLKVADAIGEALSKPDHGREILSAASAHAAVIFARAEAVDWALHDAAAALDLYHNPPAEPEIPPAEPEPTPPDPSTDPVDTRPHADSAPADPEPEAARQR